MTMTRRIAIVPLDDRPVNTRFIDDLGAALGMTVHRPPADIVGGITQSAPSPALDQWITDAAASSDALIVNLNQLAFGGYVSSRRFDELSLTVLHRLDVLREVRARHPELPVRAFVTLMRTRDANHSGGAEPDYWDQHGRSITRHSAEMYHREHGHDELAPSVDGAPRDILDDFYLRRLRLHTLQLAAIEAVVDGTLDELMIGVEDSRVDSVSTSEREWLTAWTQRFGIEDRVRCYPGADEIAAAQLAAIAALGSGSATRMRLLVDDPAALDSIVKFEDVPVRTTLESQCRTAGVVCVDDGEDVVLAVHAPTGTAWDWNQIDSAPTASDRSALARFAERIADEIARGSKVVVADIAQANGGDPALIDALEAQGVLHLLAGYSGWNTAGNTLGSAIAIASAAASAHGDGIALDRLLAHRVLEDVGYQSQVRRPLLRERVAPSDAAPGIHDLLDRRLAALPSLAARWRLDADSVRFPWDRLFEIDFQLEPRRQQ